MKILNAFPKLGIASPNFDSIVIAAAYKSLPIWTKGNGSDVVGMTAKSADFCACTYLPDFDSFIPTTASKKLPIRAKGN